jgi:hypothetical protein
MKNNQILSILEKYESHGYHLALYKKIAVYLHHCLNLCTETSVGLRHGVLVEFAHQLLDLWVGTLL